MDELSIEVSVLINKCTAVSRELRAHSQIFVDDIVGPRAQQCSFHHRGNVIGRDSLFDAEVDRRV